MKTYRIDIIKTDGITISVQKHETTVYSSATKYFNRSMNLIGKAIKGMVVTKVKMYISKE